MQHKKDGAAWDTAPNYPWRYSVVWFRVFLMLNRILSIYLFISIFIRTDGMSVNDGIHRDCSVYIEVVPLAITLLLCPSYGTYPPFFQKSTKSAVLPIWKTAPII